MKEQILQAFDELGFKMNPVEEVGYEFNYEGSTFLYMVNEDEDFLNIAIPGILEINEERKDVCHELMDKINSNIKYIKAFNMGNSIWLSYERELLGGEDLKLLLSRMIYHLEAALFFMRGNDDTGNENQEDDEGVVTDDASENILMDNKEMEDENGQERID